MPMASDATRMSNPVSGSLKRRACLERVSGGSCQNRKTQKGDDDNDVYCSDVLLLIYLQ